MSWQVVPDVSKDIAALSARVKQQLRKVSSVEDSGIPSLRSVGNHSRSFRARQSQLLSVTIILLSVQKVLFTETTRWFVWGCSSAIPRRCCLRTPPLADWRSQTHSQSRHCIVYTGLVPAQSDCHLLINPTLIAEEQSRASCD
jgi:hypothetical protein